MHLPTPAPEEAGFVLPLSVAGALVLLLSSLSMQSLVLHTHQVQAAGRSRVQREDRLASAAQVVAAQLQGPFACLQPKTSVQWSAAVALAPCPPALDLQSLQQLEIAGESVALQSWEPQPGGGLLQLHLSDSGVSRRFRLSPAGIQELG